MTEPVTLSTAGTIAIIEINNPPVNALSQAVRQGLYDAVIQADADTEITAIVIIGAGRSFPAGADIKEFDQPMQDPQLPDVIDRIENCEKPVVAALHGTALGGGFEIALACDLIIASENARFALPEPKVGLAALAGGMHRLPRQIGMKRAMGMMLTGRTVEAQEGLSLGFVNEVVAHEDLMDSAKKWAESIMECSPTSVRTTKDVAMSGLSYASVETAMEQKYDSVLDLFKGEDFVEGPLAFSEKRKPNWTGK